MNCIYCGRHTIIKAKILRGKRPATGLGLLWMPVLWFRFHFRTKLEPICQQCWSGMR